MPRDYKNRASIPRKNKSQQQPPVVWWKWLLIFLIIVLFITFLFFLKDSNTAVKPQKKTAVTTKKTTPPPKHQDNIRKEPRYDFYTILPETEVVVPDYEINTRRREERLGKRKASKYIIQAGSFRHFAQADKLKAKLALSGIESKIEKADVRGVTWNRVKIGPYTHSSHVAKIKKRLKKESVDAIVIEIKN